MNNLRKLLLIYGFIVVVYGTISYLARFYFPLLPLNYIFMPPVIFVGLVSSFFSIVFRDYLRLTPSFLNWFITSLLITIIFLIFIIGYIHFRLKKH